MLAICLLIPALAEDWPEWRGKGRRGIWNESGNLDNFSEKGLTVSWRTPIHGGFAGPAVAADRVFVTDFEPSAGLKGTERALCLDEKSGKILWTRTWNANYGGISYPIGPRATPTVDGDRVYIVGGQPDAKVMAFDKMTGKEIWRALPADSEQGYCQPVIFEVGGIRQLIIWHPAAVVSLDPATGKVYWQQPFRINMGMTLATPVLSGSRLLVSSFYNGSMLLELVGKAANILWKGKSKSEIETDGLHAVINTPVIEGDYIYGICSYGQFRCLSLKTGERVWETIEVTKEKARWASGLIVRQGDRYFINNDRGELIIAKLSPQGYQEISRTQLIKPTTNSGNRRELGAVNWSHPAYANRCIFARNDEEIISVSLEKQR